MTDLDYRLQDVRRALETMDPPADLWQRVVERGNLGESATPARHVAARSRRLPRLLAAAAVVAAVALVGAVLSRSDDQTIDTGPANGDDRSVDTLPGPVRPAPAPAPAPSTVVSGHGCPFGIAGDPVAMQRGPVDPLAPLFDAEPGQNIAHTLIGSQVVEVRVPGFSLERPGDWRMEEIELPRGPAMLWLDGPASGEAGKPFVQVRWASGSDEPCGSFTVTVDGGTEESNRRVAVDLAERILLPRELGDADVPGAEGGPVAGLELAGTEWEVVSTTSGSGPAGAAVAFSDTTVTLEEGCATVRADYDLDRPQGILTLTNYVSTDPGCTPPTVFEGRGQGWAEIRAVMETERIEAAYILDFPGGADGEGQSLLRLGDPEGDHILLAPA
jgi:hypothetical protein